MDIEALKAQTQSDKTIIIVHAHSRADFSCYRKGQLARVMNLRPRSGKPRRLEGGSLMHRMLEVYYQLKAWSDFDENFIIDESVIYGRKCLVLEQMVNLDQVEAEFIIQRFREYCEFYRNDTWSPVLIEHPFIKTLYEDENYHILGESQIDFAGTDSKQGGVPGLFVADHKTEEKASVPDILQDQGYMYAWWSNQPYVISNRIGLQKKKEDPFHRETLVYDDIKVQEWVEEVTQWAIDTDQRIKSGFLPRNFALCHQYGLCVYHEICKARPEDRDRIINRDFIVVEDRNHFAD